MALDRGRERIVIDGVKPEIGGGGFPIKRTVGERVVIEADVFVDGHDEICWWGLICFARRESGPAARTASSFGLVGVSREKTERPRPLSPFVIPPSPVAPARRARRRPCTPASGRWGRRRHW